MQFNCPNCKHLLGPKWFFDPEGKCLFCNKPFNPNKNEDFAKAKTIQGSKVSY